MAFKNIILSCLLYKRTLNVKEESLKNHLHMLSVIIQTINFFFTDSKVFIICNSNGKAGKMQ